MQNLKIIPRKKTMSLPELVADAGIEIDKCPSMFGKCFDQTPPSGVLGGLSKVIGNALPDDIDGIYANAMELTDFMLNHNNVQKCKAFKQYHSIVAPFFAKAMAYIIVDRHPQVEIHPGLMQIRRVIHANKELCEVSAIGANKGPHAQDVKDAYRKAACAKGIVHVPMAAFAAMYEYVATQAILAEDETAKTIVKMVNFNRQLLLS